MRCCKIANSWLVFVRTHFGARCRRVNPAYRMLIFMGFYEGNGFVHMRLEQSGTCGAVPLGVLSVCVAINKSCPRPALPVSPLRGLPFRSTRDLCMPPEFVPANASDRPTAVERKIERERAEEVQSLHHAQAWASHCSGRNQNMMKCSRSTLCHRRGASVSPKPHRSMRRTSCKEPKNS